MALTNITSKIKDEANHKAEEIIARAKKEASNQIAEIDGEIDKIKSDIIGEAEKTAAERAERLLASKELEGRKRLLETKQKIIADCFTAALKQLATMSDSDYDALIDKMSAGLEGEVVRLPRDKKAGTGGGFILKKGSVEVNFSFAALAQNSRERLEKDLVGILFS